MIFQPVKEGVLCFIKAVPSSSRTALGEILELPSGEEMESFLKVYLKAPAIENKANKELMQFLAHIWHVKISQITILKGASQPYKTLLIQGDSESLLKTMSLTKIGKKFSITSQLAVTSC